MLCVWFGLFREAREAFFFSLSCYLTVLSSSQALWYRFLDCWEFGLNSELHESQAGSVSGLSAGQVCSNLLRRIPPELRCLIEGTTVNTVVQEVPALYAFTINSLFLAGNCVDGLKFLCGRGSLCAAAGSAHGASSHTSCLKISSRSPMPSTLGVGIRRSSRFGCSLHSLLQTTCFSSSVYACCWSDLSVCCFHDVFQLQVWSINHSRIHLLPCLSGGGIDLPQCGSRV